MSVMSGVHCQTSTSTMPIMAVLELARIDLGPRMPTLWNSQ